MFGGLKMEKLFRTKDKLSDVIANDYRLLQIVSRFGISLGFGEKTIEEVCIDNNIDCNTFLAVINYVKAGAQHEPQNVQGISVETLVKFLRETHSYYLEYLLPNIRRKLLSSIDCSVKNEVAFLFLKFYDDYTQEVRTHMDFESSTVFSFVDQLLKGEMPSPESVHLMSKHHDKMEERLGELKNLFLQYYPQKENNNELMDVLLSVYRCEEDLTIHCLIEDNIFVPAVRKLEHANKIHRPKRVKEEFELTQQIDSELSLREKEIVTCVAKGMANKEIADKLCLSINTVTTHRRNIARKLRIHSSAGITIYAIVNKLVTLDEVNM